MYQEIIMKQSNSLNSVIQSLVVLSQDGKFEYEMVWGDEDVVVLSVWFEYDKLNIDDKLMFSLEVECVDHCPDYGSTYDVGIIRLLKWDGSIKCQTKDLNVVLKNIFFYIEEDWEQGQDMFILKNNVLTMF